MLNVEPCPPLIIFAVQSSYRAEKSCRQPSHSTQICFQLISWRRNLRLRSRSEKDFYQIAKSIFLLSPVSQGSCANYFVSQFRVEITCRLWFDCTDLVSAKVENFDITRGLVPQIKLEVERVMITSQGVGRLFGNSPTSEWPPGIFKYNKSFSAGLSAEIFSKINAICCLASSLDKANGRKEEGRKNGQIFASEVLFVLCLSVTQTN